MGRFGNGKGDGKTKFLLSYIFQKMVVTHYMSEEDFDKITIRKIGKRLLECVEGEIIDGGSGYFPNICHTCSLCLD